MKKKHGSDQNMENKEKIVYCDLEGENIPSNACKKCKEHLSTCPHQEEA